MVRYFVLFLNLDLLTKAIAQHYQPHNVFFKFIYNPNMALGFSGNVWLYWVFPLVALPLPYIMFKKIGTKDWILGMFYAGYIGNMLGRLHERGVIDFIATPWFICNLADIFGWIAFAGQIHLLYKMDQTEAILQKEKTWKH